MIHLDTQIGLTMEAVTCEQKTNIDGQPYWVCRQPIGTIFGSEVNGECSGIGRTQEQAMERLQEDVRKLSESIWA
jgi:hypothetical protein